MAQVLEYFFPGDCYKIILQDFDFTQGNCLNIVLSRWLSFAVLLGALGVKVPQIIKIVRSHSTENLSYLAFILELAAVTFTSSYNYAKGFAFSTYGESFFLVVQIVIILILMGVVQNQYLLIALFGPIYGVLYWVLVSGLTPISVLVTLQGTNIPLIIVSRATQVITTYRNGTTGQLSFVTALLNLLGTMARVFTTLQETQDLLMLASFITSTTINAIIVFQFFWYWNMPTTLDKDKKE